MTSAHEKDTATRESVSLACKQLFALGMASFPDLTYDRVAVATLYSSSTVKAWADMARPDHVPPMSALVRIRQRMPAFGAYLELGMDVLVREAPRGPVAHTIEAQTNVMCASLARLLGVHTESFMDAHYDDAEVRRLVTVLASHIVTCQRTLAMAEERLARIDRGDGSQGKGLSS